MKYIDAEGLRVTIEKRINIASCPFIQADFGVEKKREGKIQAYNEILALIDSLQQEQPEVQNGKFVFPKCLYARTKDNKTIDISYVPQDMTAVEYIRNDFVEQEPEVDLEKEFEDYLGNMEGQLRMWHPDEQIEWAKDIARHFYELARQKYEK